jgi:excisionase family DNA binding protein
MHVTETISVEQAAAALGLRPAAVRLRIKSGEIRAAMVGRRWRVGISSINLLLSGAEPVRSSSIFLAPHPQSTPAPPVAHAPIKQPIQSSPYNDTDLAHIRRFRVELSHPDPDIRATARFQLMMFQERADQQAAWKDRPVTVAKPSPEVMANLF